MNGWIIAGVVLAIVLAVVLFAPVEARLRLTPQAGFTFRLRMLGLPVRLSGARRPDRRRKSRVRDRFSLRKGRALLEVARTPGAFGLARRTLRRAVDAVELRRACLIVTLGLGDGFWTGMVAGLVRAVRPRFQAGDGRVLFEVTPDFGARRIDADGDLVLRTRLAPWAWLALTLLCSRTAWDMRRAWREELRD